MVDPTEREGKRGEGSPEFIELLGYRVDGTVTRPIKVIGTIKRDSTDFPN